MTREHIVCMSSIDWDAKWQVHQEVAAALAAAGNDVLFIENTGVRPPARRDLPRLSKRIRHWSRMRGGLRTVRPRLEVHAPILLPFPYSRAAVRTNRAIVQRVVRRWAGRVGCRRPVLLTFLPTPLVGELARAISPELTIYYCVDDFASSSPAAARIQTSETAWLRRADVVLVTAERLRAKAAAYRDDVHVLPAGVAFAEFERVRLSPASRESALDGIGRPIVACVGGINTKTDVALLAGVALRLPDVHFAVAGPVAADRGPLGPLPNVHLLGLRPHAEIPWLLKAAAAGLIPYRVTPYTAHIYPAKLNEYLAMGLPVVSTPLPEIVRFNETHGPVVSIAGGADAFADAIRRAIEETSPVDAGRRLAIAHANRWEAKVARLMDIVGRALVARRARENCPPGREAIRA